MKFLFFSIIIVICQKTLAQTSYVFPIKILSKHGYQLGLSGQYWQSSKRVDQNGRKFSLNEGESFERIQTEVSGLYGLTENLQIGGGLRYRQNISKTLNSTTGDINSETSSGVQSTFLNMMFGFRPVGQLYYAIEGTFRYTPYTNEESSGTNPGKLILGDDGNEYSVGAGVTYALKNKNFLSAKGGYRKPGKHLSSELFWQLEGALSWQFLSLIAGAEGVSSMNNDPYGSDATNRPVFETGSSGLYQNINRGWLAPYAGVNFAIGSSWRIELRASQVLSGKSTDLGTNLGISLFKREESQKTVNSDRIFKEYDFEASVTKISPKKGYVIIDKGISEDVQKGMKVDFYEFDYVGGNILLARGTVVKSGADTAIVKITHLYNSKKELKEGIVARGSFR
jgi:hypothetical protein